MYYEIYIDIVFLINFCMNCIILLLVRKAMKCSATYAHILLGSGIGAISICAVIIIPLHSVLFCFVIIHLLISIGMLKIGLNLKGRKNLMRGIVFLYLFTFLVGGIFEWLYPYLTQGGKQGLSLWIFLICTVFAYMLIKIILRLYKVLKPVETCYYAVTVYLKEHCLKLTGLLDTGNSLKDPISKQPVCVIDKATAAMLFEKDMDLYGKGIRMIPFHTIGNKNGIMPAFRADKLCVEVEENMVEIPDVLLGISEQPVSTGGNYEIILNPMLIDY